MNEIYNSDTLEQLIQTVYRMADSNSIKNA